MWVLLVTFGIMGIFSSLTHVDRFINKGYFHSSQFQYELHNFIHNLRTFELHSVTKEEAKQLITVTDDEIEEHR